MRRLGGSHRRPAAAIALGNGKAGFMFLVGETYRPEAMGRRLRVPASEGVYAQECFRRLGRNPRDPDGLFARAAVLASLGRWTEAIASLDLLTEVAPRYPGLWRFKARLYAEAGDPGMERLCLEAASRIDSP